MRLGRFFRHLLFWAIPIFATVLLVVSGFVYWLVATPTGTRWAMNTLALQFDGQSRGVEGSVWHGLQVDELRLDLPDDLRVELEGVEVKVDWLQLWHSRELRVNTLGARRVAVWVNGEPQTEEKDAAPFVMPELPVSVRVDQLALGELYVELQGQALPVDLSQLNLQATGVLNHQGAQLQVESVRVGYESIWLEADAAAQLTQLMAPWHSAVQLSARAFSDETNSPICLEQYLPTHLKPSGPTDSVDAESALCAINANIDWQGSLDDAVLTVTAVGQGMDVDARSRLQLSQAFPVRDTTVVATLPDGSGVQAELDWQRDAQDLTLDRLAGSIQATKLDVGAWLPDVDLPAVITLSGDYAAQLSQGATVLDQAQLALTIADTSRWNGQVLKGHVQAEVARRLTEKPLALWQSYDLNKTDIDLSIGTNHLQAKGAFGLKDHVLKLLVNAPAIQQLWPELDKIGATKLEAELQGTLFDHKLTADLHHVLTAADPKAKVGNGPVEAQLSVAGHWNPDPTQPSWQGQIQQVAVQHAGLGATIDQAFTLKALLPSAEQEFALDVGAFNLQTFIDNASLLALQHDKTHVASDGFSTKGQSAALTLSAQRVNELMKRFGLEQASNQRGGVIDTRQGAAKVEDLSLQLEWDLRLTDALAGQVRLQRLGGDILIPAQPAFPLGLKQTEIVLNMVPGSSGRSVLQLDAALETEKMGYVKAKGSSPIYYSKDQGIQLREADRKELVIDAHMDSLSWTSLILQDQLELGGELVANVTLASLPNGGFSTQGEITGQHLKITRLDDGVRLLDGQLKANLNNNRFTVERLYFPAQLRVEPKEWRTATWIKEDPEAKDGSLLLSGYWDLEQNIGDFDLKLHRYPLLQRADRYAMVSGELLLKAILPQINISGKIKADAGWFNLDMLGGIPTIDGDIVIVRSTDPVIEVPEETADPINMTMDLEVDLGPRFYLTGYGVNSGLVGQMNIHMADGQLTALGALNTRGGAIEMYGQRLQLRRGTVTFQGDITSPILDIQALRTGLSVQAGVKVGGTARKPKIDLISTPEVSELEKLSWLLFGHGPDDGGGDLALLLSVGTSFLGGGEPFYRRFGIDELSMRSGELGGAGSILPATSTASSQESEVSEVERRFIEVSKRLSADVTVSMRQALSDTGTVGRASYKLTRRLTAELSIGTVSGLALIYRWFSQD